MYRKRRARRRRGPRSRAAGCLLWVVLAIVLLILLAVLFGGFHKTTQFKGTGSTEIGPSHAGIVAGRLY